jgi:hypothetical protein
MSHIFKGYFSTKTIFTQPSIKLLFYCSSLPSILSFHQPVPFIWQIAEAAMAKMVTTMMLRVHTQRLSRNRAGHTSSNHTTNLGGNGCNTPGVTVVAIVHL